MKVLLAVIAETRPSVNPKIDNSSALMYERRQKEIVMKPGDMVVCIENFTRPHRHVVQKPVKGMVYTIRSISPGLEAKNRNLFYLKFEELINPIVPKYNMECGFVSTHFRPVKRTDISVFTGMLTPTDDKVGA